LYSQQEEINMASTKREEEEAVYSIEIGVKTTTSGDY
jgi:hypothetical protein